MCVWYYAESKSLSYSISKAQQLPLAHEMMVTMSRSMAMSGNIRPTDMAAVLAPNKQSSMAVFPMIWGFTHEATEKPIVNCRVESADQKAMWIIRRAGLRDHCTDNDLPHCPVIRTGDNCQSIIAVIIQYLYLFWLNYFVFLC